MANSDMEAAKKAVAKDAELANRSKEEFAARTKGKPTPTQSENDLAACGAHIQEHEADGSDPDPNVRHSDKVEKHMEAKPAPAEAGYQTRQQRSHS